MGSEVLVRAEGRFPERVLNLCGGLGIPLRDPRQDTPDTLTFWVSARDWRRLRPYEPETGCVFRVLERRGALLRRLRRRPVLAVSAVVIGAALFLGSFFVWDFQVTGNETVPTERILRALERQGVGLGSFGLSLDGESLRNHVLEEIPELAWISVNVSGCLAKVDVRERVPAPALLDEAAPTNVTARRDGLILEVRALDGMAAVGPGAAVRAGELLISGVEDLSETVGGSRVMAGHGSVLARTWRTLTTSVPLSGLAKRYTGQERTGLSLVLGQRRIKFFSNRGISDLEAGTNYDKITERTPWTLLGVPLPVTTTRETYRFYELVPAAWTVAQVRDRAEAALRFQLQTEVEPYGEIRSALCSFRQRGDTLDVTLSAECVEEIGVLTPVYTAENSGT